MSSRGEDRGIQGKSVILLDAAIRSRHDAHEVNRQKWENYHIDIFPLYAIIALNRANIGEHYDSIKQTH